MILRTSQAFSLSKVEGEICSLMLPLTTHLLKVKLYPNHPSMAHWRSEIMGWLRDIRSYAFRVKTKTGKVKEETLIKWMLEMAPGKDDFWCVQERYGKSDEVYAISDYEAAIKRTAPLILNGADMPDILKSLLA